MDQKLNVLLVDDSRTVLAQLERIVTDMDHVAVVGLARNGAAAIREAGESKPDLILMDVIMPGLDGLSALRTIKAMLPKTEVVMVTSVGGDARKAEQAFKLGASQIIGKPFDIDAIASIVETVRGKLSEEAGRETGALRDSE